MSPKRPESGPAAYLRAFARQFRDRLIEARCPQVAGSLAFTTLLALVPLLTVGLIVFASLPAFKDVSATLQDFLLQNLLPATAGKIIATYAVQFSQKATNLTVIGTTFVVVTAVMLVLTIDRAFNQIWAVSHRRPLLTRLSMYWVGLTVGPMALAVVLALIGQIASMSLGLVDAADHWFRPAMARATTLFVLATLFTIIYIVLPNRPVRFVHAAFGGILAAILLSLLQRLFALYLTQFPTYTLIYGTFAALPTFLLWLYLSWLVVLVCAVVVAVLPEVGLRGSPRQAFPGDQLLAALQLLAHLSEAQRSGATPSIEMLASETGLGLSRSSHLLEEMHQAGWVVTSDAGNWLLAIRCSELKLRDLLQGLLLSPRGLAESDEALGLALAHRLEQLHGPFDEPLSELIDEARQAPQRPQIG